MKVANSTPTTSPSDLDVNIARSAMAERRRTLQALHAVNQANMFGSNRRLTFTFDSVTNRMVIHVIDRDTRETVMQLPAEHLLRLWANLEKPA